MRTVKDETILYDSVMDCTTKEVAKVLRIPDAWISNVRQGTKNGRRVVMYDITYP